MEKSILELTHEQRVFIKDFVKAIKNGNAAVFAGAGLSIPSGTMSWSELLVDIAEELELSGDNTTDMATLAQYYVNYKSSRKEIAELIMESFNTYIQPNINQELVAQLPIETIWTTNYDDLLEKAYQKEYKKVSVKRSPDDFSLSNQKNDVVIYKMHGDVTQPTNAIITKNDYETYNDTHLVYTTALKGDLVEKKFLFVGFSFEDPNLEYILARIKALVGENKPNHYFFIEKIKHRVDESNVEFGLRQTKQSLKIKDLKRYGINAVLLDSYNEVTQVLRIVKQMSNLQNIFISGAKTEQYNIPDELSNQLVLSITDKLVMKKNKIISGFGLGVGSQVINAVLNTVSHNPWSKLDEHLKIYPFPQTKETDWKLYRKEILKEVGILICLFGTKIENGKHVLSSGMIEEFEIAHKMGIKVIPVGCTGGASREIFNLVMKNPKEYYDENNELIELIQKLGAHPIENKEDINTLIILILSIVKKIQSMK